MFSRYRVCISSFRHVRSFSCFSLRPPGGSDPQANACCGLPYRSLLSTEHRTLTVVESLFMLFDTIVAFDSYLGIIKVITYLRVPEKAEDVEAEYRRAAKAIEELVDVLNAPEIPLPEQKPVHLGQDYKSNIGREGYEAH